MGALIRLVAALVVALIVAAGAAWLAVQASPRPAIALIEQRCEVVNVDSGTDYRLRQLEKAPLYFDAASSDIDARLAARFEAIAGVPGQTGSKPQAIILPNALPAVAVRRFRYR